MRGSLTCSPNIAEKVGGVFPFTVGKMMFVSLLALAPASLKDVKRSTMY